MSRIKRTERGWAGHFICAHRCRFRRNTLLEYGDIKIVVSTVGLMEDSRENSKFAEIGLNRYYETMVFHADYSDVRYHDADVSRQTYFDSPWSIDFIDADDLANSMHEIVVDEISQKLLNGERFSKEKDEFSLDCDDEEY